MEKHKKDKEEAGLVSLTELTKNHRSYLEGQHIGQRRLQDTVGERRFQFSGHILRIAPERSAHSAINWTPANGRKKAGQYRSGGQYLHAKGVS